MLGGFDDADRWNAHKSPRLTTFAQLALINDVLEKRLSLLSRCIVPSHCALAAWSL